VVSRKHRRVTVLPTPASARKRAVIGCSLGCRLSIAPPHSVRSSNRYTTPEPSASGMVTARSYVVSRSSTVCIHETVRSWNRCHTKPDRGGGGLQRPLLIQMAVQPLELLPGGQTGRTGLRIGRQSSGVNDRVGGDAVAQNEVEGGDGGRQHRTLTQRLLGDQHL
jgi:hypothetical protein